jgi:hypothetical protein
MNTSTTSKPAKSWRVEGLRGSGEYETQGEALDVAQRVADHHQKPATVYRWVLGCWRLHGRIGPVVPDGEDER